MPNEKTPTPITRGIEIQKTRAEAVRIKASEASSKVADLSRQVHERISAEFAKGLGADNLEKLEELFSQHDALEEIARKLEDIIIRHEDFDDELTEHLSEIQTRMSKSER